MWCTNKLTFLKTCFVEFTNASQINAVNRKLFEVNLKVLFNNQDNYESGEAVPLHHNMKKPAYIRIKSISINVSEARAL